MNREILLTNLNLALLISATNPDNIPQYQLDDELAAIETVIKLLESNCSVKMIVPYAKIQAELSHITPKPSKQVQLALASKNSAWSKVVKILTES